MCNSSWVCWLLLARMLLRHHHQVVITCSHSPVPGPSPRTGGATQFGQPVPSEQTCALPRRLNVPNLGNNSIQHSLGLPRHYENDFAAQSPLAKASGDGLGSRLSLIGTWLVGHSTTRLGRYFWP